MCAWGPFPCWRQRHKNHVFGVRNIMENLFAALPGLRCCANTAGNFFFFPGEPRQPSDVIRNEGVVLVSSQTTSVFIAWKFPFLRKPQHCASVVRNVRAALVAAQISFLRCCMKVFFFFTGEPRQSANERNSEGALISGHFVNVVTKIVALLAGI